MTHEQLFSFLTPFFVGFLLGVGGFWLIQQLKLGKYKYLANEIIHKAELDAKAIIKANELLSKEKEMEQQREMERHWRNERRKILAEEERVKGREERIYERIANIDKKVIEIERKESLLQERKERFKEQKHLNENLQNKLLQELEKVSGLTNTEARDLYLKRIETQTKTHAANLTRKIKAEAKEHAEIEASKIIATAINRLASSCVSETTINTISLPSDEMKGRVIGKEGRNIRALEQATGVNFIIDDTPGTVVISGYDPVRKEIAKLALQELISDGRIHPTSIEEAVVKARLNINKSIKKYGEDAALRAGIVNFHPEIIKLLGKLQFRYSYGQNILTHSLEVAHILEMMAAELGLDTNLARRIGILHDIGKAVSHEIEGGHAIIGHDLALKYGETAAVANGIGSHHNEITPSSIIGSLCCAADAISASRPGARIEAVEEYIRRLKKLESVAQQFPGVEKAYALQAGREIRVIVSPDEIDDDGIINMAREMATAIEHELTFPGKIKVTIIREKRCIEYAV